MIHSDIPNRSHRHTLFPTVGTSPSTVRPQPEVRKTQPVSTGFPQAGGANVMGMDYKGVIRP